MKTWIKISMLFLLSLLIQFLYLDKIFTQPNAHLFSLAGDGFIIYYNFLFHTCHGSGLMLDGMNYPWGEFMFLTDAMSAFSWILASLRGMGLDLCVYGIGIMHWLIIGLVPLCAIFLYLIFRRQSISDIIALPGSLLICFLSPQIARFLSHFGLAFPMLIPACILWYLYWREKRILDVWGIALIIMLCFFGLNNPYLVFICTSFLSVTILCDYILDKNLAQFFKALLVTLSPLAIVFFIVKFGDPFHDRVKIQWGFFHYAADWRGLIMPEGSLFRKWFGDLTHLPSVIWESRVNIGIVPTMILAISIIMIPFRKRIHLAFNVPRELWTMLVAAFCLFLFGAHFFLGDSGQAFIEDQLDFIMMFKSPARLLWPMYFVLTIMSVYLINSFFKFLKPKNTWGAYGFMALLAVIWTAEIGQYVNHRFAEFRFDNKFQYGLEEIDEYINSNELTTTDYQAIYTLPKMQAWNDKLYVPLEYVTNHYGLILSYRTGIPLISAMYSRMSISQTLLSQQFSSDPLIEKSLIEYLDPNKKILLLQSKQLEMTRDEQHLIDGAELIVEDERFNIFSLALDKPTSSSPLKDLRDNYNGGVLDSLMGPEHFYFLESFNDLEHKGLSGNGLRTDKGLAHIALIELGDQSIDDEYEFSIWTQVDHKKYGMPTWKIEFYNEAAENFKSLSYSCREENTIYKDWLRLTQNFHIPGNTKRIEIKAKTNQHFLVDELLIRHPLDTIYKPIDESHFMFNNLRIDLVGN